MMPSLLMYYFHVEIYGVLKIILTEQQPSDVSWAILDLVSIARVSCRWFARFISSRGRFHHVSFISIIKLRLLYIFAAGCEGNHFYFLYTVEVMMQF